MRNLAFSSNRPAIRVVRCAANFTDPDAARVVAFYNVKAVRTTIFNHTGNSRDITVIAVIVRSSER